MPVLRRWQSKRSAACARLRAPTDVASDLTRARDLFAAERQRLRDAQQAIIQHRRTATHLVERVKVQRLLIKAALVEITWVSNAVCSMQECIQHRLASKRLLGCRDMEHLGAHYFTLHSKQACIPARMTRITHKSRTKSSSWLSARFGQLRNEARQAVERVNAVRLPTHAVVIAQDTIKTERYLSGFRTVSVCKRKSFR